MKFSIIVLLIFNISFLYSFKISKNNGKSNTISDCLNSLNGFKTDFESVAYNIDWPNGPVSYPFSYSEYGQYTVDYINQRFHVFFNNTMGGSVITNGMFWGFLNNNTQYEYIVEDGVEICVKQDLQFTYEEKLYETNKISNIKIGNFNCEIYNTKSILNNTKEEMVVDPSNCAFIYSKVENIVGGIGKAIYFYYNFEADPDTSDFKLPNACHNPITKENPNISFSKLYLLNHINKLF